MTALDPIEQLYILVGYRISTLVVSASTCDLHNGTMGREEQAEEREVLDSIFPEEITGIEFPRPLANILSWPLTTFKPDISDTSYQVSIALDVDFRSADDEEPVQRMRLSFERLSTTHTRVTLLIRLSSIAAFINLIVTYPLNYPDEPPILEVSNSKDLSNHDYLSFPEDGPQLLATLDETIQDSLGAAMVFTLISTLKDSAESLIASRTAAVQAEVDKAAVEAEAKENAKFHGEAVTRQSFLAWREKFVEEQKRHDEEEERRAEEGGTRGKKVVKEEKKMTGRELWERGLVGKVDEDEGGEEEGEKDALAGVEKLTLQE